MAGAALTGQLIIDGAIQLISATLAKDGSVSGRIANPDGKSIGKFWGQRGGGQLRGSFDLGGRIGSWSVPASKLPIPK